MSESDPVLRAWQRARAADATVHPDATELALAAQLGLEALSDGGRRHLLEGHCPTCEVRLSEAWKLLEPPASLLAAINDIAPDSTLGAALTALARDAPASNPGPPLSRAGVRTMLERLGATLVELLYPDQPIGALNDPDTSTAGTAAPPVRPGRFGEHISLTPMPDQPGRVRLEIDTDRLGLGGTTALVLVLREGVEKPLAVIELERPAGVEEREVELDAGVALGADVRVALGRRAP